MKSPLRVLLWVAAAGLVLAGLTLAWIYLASESLIHRRHEAPLTTLALPDDAAAIAEGKRLARLRGCYGGCHGKTLEGRVWADGFLEGRVVAPDLTRVARDMSVAELARAIREGIRHNGESVWEMPSPMMFHLSDDDLAKIIAFLRSAAPLNGLPRELSYGLLPRWEVVRGNYRSMRTEIEALGPPSRSPDPSDPLDVGRYLARTVCSECHGTTLQGGDGTPNLHVMAQAYAADQFSTLMRTGVAVGGRRLGLMSGVAKSRFAYFTDGEIAALYAFLRSAPR